MILNLLIGACIAIAASTIASASEVGIAVSARSDAEREARSALTDLDVRALYQFVTSKLPDGEKATLILMPSNSQEHRVFLIRYLGMSKNAYKRLKSLQTNGRKNVPVEVLNSLQVYYRIVDSTASVGYMGPELLELFPNDKAILIEVE